MDPQTQASFIPKRPLVAAGSFRHSGSVLWAVSLFIFLTSLASAAGVFAYGQYLKSTIASASASLARAQAAYDPSVINDIIRLNERLVEAKQILADHVAPSGLFAFLENNTLSSVRFSDFSYTLTSSRTATIALSGEALDFSSVALQSDAFGTSKLLHDVLFTDITVNTTTGHITFKVTAAVDPSLIAYNPAPAAPGTATSSPAGAPAGTATPTAPTPTDAFGNPLP